MQEPDRTVGLLHTDPGIGVPTLTVDTVVTLDELAALVDRRPGLYVRWSKGPDDDARRHSRDGLTGLELPGLSANPLSVEDWWGDQPVRTWVARRLFDYRHLGVDRGPGVRPWVLEAAEQSRGPDNEPVVADWRPVAWIDDAVLDEVETEIAAAGPSDTWGPLRR